MKRSEKEIKLDEKIGFGCSLKNMFVGVVKPETYMKNGQWKDMACSDGRVGYEHHTLSIYILAAI